MPGSFDTSTLAGVVERLYRRPRFFLDTFFTTEIWHDTEQVHFDVVNGAPRISPFVHPRLPGKVVQERGYEQRSVRPAYIKDKRVFTPDAPLKRRPGEILGGNLSADQRLDANIADALKDQLEMLQGRIETMAVEAIVEGRQTVIGEGFNDYVVDFKRPGSLALTLAGTDKWDDAGNNDRGSQLEDWSQLLQDEMSVSADLIIMDRKAYKLLCNDEKFLKLYTAPRQDNPVTLNPYPSTATDEVRFMGTLNELPIYVYSYKYEDPETGALTNAFPENTVVIASKNVAGHRHFGYIRDLKNVGKRDFFVKSYEEDDPSVRYMVLQSAPLMVPHRPASIRIKVA